MWHPWIDWWQLKSFACNSFHLWNGVKVPCPYNNNLPGNHCGNMMKYATYAWSCSEISQSFSFKICSLFVHHNEWNAAVGIWKLTPPRWFWGKADSTSQVPVHRDLKNGFLFLQAWVIFNHYDSYFGAIFTHKISRNPKMLIFSGLDNTACGKSRASLRGLSQASCCHVAMLKTYI